MSGALTLTLSQRERGLMIPIKGGRDIFGYWAMRPPSMTISLPVTKDESSEARNRTPLAMSSTVPSLPSGMLSR